jgi:hypothetical protein
VDLERAKGVPCCLCRGGGVLRWVLSARRFFALMSAFVFVTLSRYLRPKKIEKPIKNRIFTPILKTNSMILIIKLCTFACIKK